MRGKDSAVVLMTYIHIYMYAYISMGSHFSFFPPTSLTEHRGPSSPITFLSYQIRIRNQIKIHPENK